MIDRLPLYLRMTPLRTGALLFLLLIIGHSSLASADDPDALVGRWMSAKKRNHVQIYKQGDRYFGKLVWMIEPNEPTTNKPKVDKRNPDERLRTRPMLNLPIMTDLVYKGDNVWGGGQIYNPEDGRTYGCEVTLRNSHVLDIRGYVAGLTFLGKTSTWTRVP